jgi:hypothetical protein
LKNYCAAVVRFGFADKAVDIAPLIALLKNLSVNRRNTPGRVIMSFMTKTTSKYYQSKYPLIKGSTIDEIVPKARAIYSEIDKSTGRRNTYIRSAYFNKEKVFLKPFWEHLYQKRRSERARRLKYYKCALDLIRNTRFEPDFKDDGRGSKNVYYRFYGKSKTGEKFVVQIHCDKRKNKYFMSCYPKK